MPKAVNIMGRSSSITNSFINGIIPVIKPTDEEIYEAFEILDQSPETVTCIYCGEKMTEWDHLNPLIVDKKATGYISEIKNLVPACGKCNQSKGNSYWRDWIMSNAELSPKSKGVKDIKRRIAILEKYEKWGNLKPYNFENIAGNELWKTHWNNYEAIIGTMKASTSVMIEIKNKLASSIIKNSNLIENNKKEKDYYNYDNRTQKKELQDEDIIRIEINKIKRRIPRWFQNKNQFNSKILIQFFGLKEKIRIVTYHNLRNSCSEIKKFDINYNQMKNFGENNHAKVFEEKNGKIELWEPVNDFIIDEYNKYKKNI